MAQVEHDVTNPINAKSQTVPAVRAVAVRGNLRKGGRPYFTVGGLKFTNKRLANSWELIGQKLLVRFDQDYANIAHISIAQSGADLGQAYLAATWAKNDMTQSNGSLAQHARPHFLSPGALGFAHTKPTST